MQKVIRLGPLETKLFSWAQNRGLTLVRTGVRIGIEIDPCVST